MTGLAKIERQQFASTLMRVGPQAPTLCEGWRTKDLAAHVVLRERRPDAAIGVLLSAVAEHTQRVQDEYAEKAWPQLINMVQEGPRGWSPTRLPHMDDAINLVEFYVHHEDVLRAAPDWTPEHTRTLNADLQTALWARLKQAGQLMFRKSPTGVVLVTPSHGRCAVHRPTKNGTVVLRGEPSELVLYATGRTHVADVEITGEGEAITAFCELELGL
ncbi:TIGR03085 family metal-binding protein [Dermatophilus congolensis]|uniref:TIGR03085 family metal-binding protein n=1 Tax=Dermatophilus congolensis TaxID=1863 RepID=UPI001AAFA2B0|nr:TIGR03085 family metal-binding protein [Dermatophilus congolensis]MBO3129530.1 TIGR03085 family protein [Dermatophilus congolensis]MBO3131835.1 TIGR03085 family protein [Dermatophilus congolensis]MBO3134008.1 TIGR03085 family protein [Dermatophilus congolensis]MBO3136239.1 TIGR03085 family protein [Dermatophilus congolensis]MBO3138485.1 TIGR03085 family protein [Dermatophilus congolensis]